MLDDDGLVSVSQVGGRCSTFPVLSVDLTLILIFLMLSYAMQAEWLSVL